MGAAADQVDIVQFLKAVAGAEVEHLAEVVRQVEGGAAVDFEFGFPIGGRADSFELDAFFDVVQADLFQVIQGGGAERGFHTLPIDIGMHVADGDEDVKADLPAGPWFIGAAGVARHKGSAGRKEHGAIRCLHVLGVIAGDENIVVLQMILLAVEAEVHHEGEQENFFLAILESLQRRRRPEGTRRRMARAKSALMTTASPRIRGRRSERRRPCGPRR